MVMTSPVRASVWKQNVAENSEVFPLGSVAVAVTDRPAGICGMVTAKEALPLPFVVTLAAPTKVWPSPKPEGSTLMFVKNSIR